MTSASILLTDKLTAAIADQELAILARNHADSFAPASSDVDPCEAYADFIARLALVMQRKAQDRNHLLAIIKSARAELDDFHRIEQTALQQEQAAH